MTKKMLGLMAVVLFFFSSNPTCFFTADPAFRLVPSGFVRWLSLVPCPGLLEYTRTG